MKKTCPHCGSEFTTEHPRQVYCARRCQLRFKEGNKRKRQISQAQALRTCLECEAPISHPSARMCSEECRTVRRRRLDRQKRTPIRLGRVLHACDRCGLVFVDTVDRVRRYCLDCSHKARRGPDYTDDGRRPFAGYHGQMPRGWPTLRRHVLEEEPACRECGDPAETVDHIVPRAAGGGHERSNLQAMCHRCHRRKTVRDSRPVVMTPRG